MPRREGPLDKFSNFKSNDPIARLIVHYFFPADFLYRDYLRVSKALAAQKRRTKWRATQEICYLRLWLAALYTVAEGFQELKLQDSEITSLLESDYLGSLRKWRNGTFHYQAHPQKHLQFFSDEDGLPTDERQEWAEHLHAAFDRFHHDYIVKITVQNMKAAFWPKDGPTR
jgi:hypothetical protein